MDDHNETGLPKKSLESWQAEVDGFIRQFGGYWPPLSMLASITEELGEIAREINALEGFKPKREGEPPASEKIREELGDCLFSLICVANYYHISLSDNLQKVIQKYQDRDTGRF